jgi:predicted  nucleic acid-binding Zn-ribbon protein
MHPQPQARPTFDSITLGGNPVASTADLYQLQQIDRMWEKVRRRLIQIRQACGESDEVSAARGAVAEAEKTLHDWQGQETDAELESQALKKRITDGERRLMSGKVKNPKELEALQASVASLRRQRADVDDKAFEALNKVDEWQAIVVERQATLTRLETAWSDKQQALDADEQKMKRNYAILKKQRETLAATLDAGALQSYERLRKRKGGVAVAKINNGNCGACNVRLPTGVISLARQDDRQVTCPSCGRTLYSG